MISDRLKRAVLGVLKLDDFDLQDDTTAAEVPGWDSLSHVAILADDHDRDVHDVQQHRRECRRAEAAMDLEDRAEERRPADEQDVGEHDGGELEGEDKVRPPVRAEQDHRADGDFADDRDAEQDGAQEVDAGSGEFICAGSGQWAVGSGQSRFSCPLPTAHCRLSFDLLRVKRDEGGRERAFAEKSIIVGTVSGDSQNMSSLSTPFPSPSVWLTPCSDGYCPVSSDARLGAHAVAIA